MRVAINSPSLNAVINLSGVSSLVKSIMDDNQQVAYIHLTYGRGDAEQVGLGGRMTEIWKSYREVYKRLKNNEFDLFHFNLVLYPKSIYRDITTFVITRAFRKKIIIHLHGGPYLFRKPKNWLSVALINFFFKKADKVIVLSQLEKESLERLYHFDQTEVFPNTVNCNVFKPAGNRKDPSVIRFLFLGRLHESKGIRLMIEAFQAIIAKGYAAELMVCGEGHLRDYVESKAKETGAIKFPGVVAGEQRMATISECDVFLLPSLYGEGLPMALLETMACGLMPIVSTDGSMKAIINNNVNGLVVTPGNLDELIEALEKAARDFSQMTDICINARATVVKNYGWENYVTSLNGFYTEAMKAGLK